ncbi:unnamed protein product [Rhizoctonia solani]|uniref:Uncharacterized protein n=1 Tax=Rhizoctonia solani TaxID=456999 RepID=A0A8H3GGT1_9AGAM|nr:unnamed protein product [Rhizoctonia solani]
MAHAFTGKDGSPYLIRIKQRGFAVYDPEQAALMMDDPPPQPKGRKIDDVPLFMRNKLPTYFPDNSHLPVHGEPEIFKGTSNEVALQFKNKGNDFFQRQKWSDAREAYIEALEFCPNDPKLQEVLWLNMAAANLELKYWPGVLSPAARALTLNLRSIKAYYRAARALINYERYEEAIDCCERALAFDPSNEAILELMDDPKLGGKVSNQAKTETAQQALEKVYKENRFIILQNRSFEPDPTNFPHIRPAIPKGKSNPNLYCNVNFKFPERNAMDVFIGVGSSVQIGNLLLKVFPGPDQAPKAWYSDIYFDPSNKSNKHAQLVRLQAEMKIMENAEGKHPLWDPAFQYLPHNLSIYLETYKRHVLKIEQSYTMSQVLKMVAESPEDDQICLEGGSIILTIFRPNCKAEKLWLEGKGRKGFALAHPKYKQTDKRAMLASGQLRTWMLISPRDNLEEISIAARSGILNNAEAIYDRA